MSPAIRRCPLCLKPVELTADAEPFVATVVYRDGEIVRTAEGRPYVVYAHAGCWYAPQEGAA